MREAAAHASARPRIELCSVGAMTQTTLLLGTDLAEGSARTADAAAAFALEAGYDLALVCAYGGAPEPDAMASPAAEALADRLRDERDRLEVGLAVERQRLLDRGAPIRSARLIEGRPDEVLLSEAERMGAAVLAIGPHVRWAGLLDRFFGSTAKRLVRRASCPVLVIPTAAAGPSRRELRGRRIVVGLGGVRVDTRALDAALALAVQTSAMVEAVHVGASDDALEDALDHLERVPAASESRLSGIRRMDDGPQGTTSTFLAAAERADAALLVLGAKPLPLGSGLRETFVERICRDADVPVLVVR